MGNILDNWFWIVITVVVIIVIGGICWYAAYKKDAYRKYGLPLELLGYLNSTGTIEDAEAAFHEGHTFPWFDQVHFEKNGDNLLTVFIDDCVYHFFRENGKWIYRMPPAN